ncbi:hypothetical protein [Geomicrobium sp. JCM 19037]|uniref:hypothetical protein n=1 Tax=Geomicrobium sp. JCM 19037 TaxID=1460634 RepID=UPI0006943F6C|nr:hypothetical protein [Geomicrobium sp. JCM 19037]
MRDPLTRAFKTAQIKTMRQRKFSEDGSVNYIIRAAKASGEPYQPADCDYIIGVLGDTLYMTECTGQWEYSSVEAGAAKRFITMKIEREAA